MTDHLPECSESMIPDFHNERWICICDQLRAHEKRVREDERMQILATAGLSWDEAIAMMSPQDAVNILQQQHKEKP